MIDANIVEEVRELRSVLEAELAALACTTLNKEQINMLWENVALWQMYMKRNDEEKIFQLDKEFHKSLYKMCNKNYWYELVNNISPHLTELLFLVSDVYLLAIFYQTMRNLWLPLRTGRLIKPVKYLNVT